MTSDPGRQLRPGGSVAIVQSNYLPWKGYFDLIASVDEFVLYDDVQYTNGDWRNRNRLKTRDGLAWLTVPVLTKGRFGQLIRETEIKGSGWRDAHWKTITQNYRRAPCFDEVAACLELAFQCREWNLLSDLNQTLIESVCTYLGIRTRITRSADYVLRGDRSERLVGLCRQIGAQVYVSGPAAKCYLDESAFAREGIAVRWFDYSAYPAYPQLWGAFVHEVSIVDLFFNCGKASGQYMKFVER